MTTTIPTPPHGARWAWRTRPLPVRAYLLGLIGVVVLAIVGGALFAFVNSRSTALADGGRDAQFSAQLGASEVDNDLKVYQSTVAAFASNPQVAKLYAPGAACTLTFSGEGAFPTARLDLLTPSGAVLCSSLGAATHASYANSSWLSGALLKPSIVAPVVDPVLGGQAVVVAAPVPVVVPVVKGL